MDAFMKEEGLMVAFVKEEGLMDVVVKEEGLMVAFVKEGMTDAHLSQMEDDGRYNLECW